MDTLPCKVLPQHLVVESDPLCPDTGHFQHSKVLFVSHKCAFQ